MEEKINKVLVIGGAGYIGSVLARMLLDRGYETTVFDRLLFGRDSLPTGWKTGPAFRFIQGDLRDLSAVSQAVRGQDAVILLAALVGEPACDRDPDETVDVNFLGTLNAAGPADYYHTPRCLFASTDSCYGIQEGVMYEDSPLKPISLYAELKKNMETGTAVAQPGNGFAPTILRLATVYGLSPRMRFDLIINILTMHAVRNRQDQNLRRPPVAPSGPRGRRGPRLFIAALEAPRGPGARTGVQHRIERSELPDRNLGRTGPGNPAGHRK